MVVFDTNILIDACNGIEPALAVSIRKNHRLKLPDATIWATALHLEATLLTRDAKDFPANDPSIHIPYRLH